MRGKIDNCKLYVMVDGKYEEVGDIKVTNLTVVDEDEKELELSFTGEEVSFEIDHGMEIFDSYKEWFDWMKRMGIKKIKWEQQDWSKGQRIGD